MKVNTLFTFTFCTLFLGVYTEAHNHYNHQQNDKMIDFEIINSGNGINEHAVVNDISKSTKDTEDIAVEETAITKVFNYLFPFGPAGNAILATTYISGPPNLILALIPANIEVSSLSLLVSFAIGGLLGDVFLHLLPETFMGQSVDLVVGDNIYILVDDRKNVVLGIGMFIGFLLFFMIDKLMRIIEHDDNDTEGNSHSHSHSHAKSSGIEIDSKDKAQEIRNRKKVSEKDEDEDDNDIKEVHNAVIENPNLSIKTSAYLNLISDFTHNITDGLAISSSFYISKNVGCTTAIATFMHEIPHEVGDFALLIQGGFSKWQAMGSQFITALGAYLGTFIGIALQQQIEASGINGDSATNSAAGILGTSLRWGDMTLPFTAGGFFYIAFSVIPELLEVHSGSTRKQSFVLFAQQLVCMGLGIGFMAFIALNE